MTDFTQEAREFIRRLREKLPDQQLGLVPADAFFTRTVELPPDLSWQETQAFVQLSLEGNAPFPIEQLAWGFWLPDNARRALVYATPKSRLKRLGIDLAGRFLHIFPGFISLLGEPADRPLIRFLSQNGILSAVHLPSGDSVPERIVSRRIDAEILTDEVQLEARDRMAAALETSGTTCEEGLWAGHGGEIGHDGSVCFVHRRLQAGAAPALVRRELPLAPDARWAADLRDPVFAGRERAVRQRSRVIWQGLRAAAAAAILLLALQLFSLGLAGFNVLRQRQLDALEPKAVRVENKLTLAQRLTQSTEEDVKPFLLLEVINQLRPDTIYFDKVRARAYNQLQVEGQSAEGVTPVNAYADSIQQLPYVRQVENNSRTRSNQTSFDFVIEFSRLPPGPEGGFVIPDDLDNPVATTSEEG